MQNNETRIVKPSVNMLPMEQIKESLDGVVESHDTDFVDGIESSQIAICHENDRYSVKNAYFLGNRAASEYLTNDNDPNKAINSLSKDYQQEVSALRLEVYRLYEILNSQLNAHYAPESGYVEDYSALIGAETTAIVIDTDNVITRIEPAQIDFALPGEYIVIDDGNKAEIAQIDSIDNQQYVLAGSINSSVREIKLTKIKGEIIQKSFSFSKTEALTESKVSHNVVLGDSTREFPEPINSGLSTDIEVKGNMLSLAGEGDHAKLKSVKAYISKSTIPNSPELICKIYKFEHQKEIGDTHLELPLIGISKTQNIFSDKWVTFEIVDTATNEDGVEIKKNDHILVAFECNGENNYTILTGVGDEDNDLHSNREIYSKTENGYEKLNVNYDIILSLSFMGYEERTTIANPDGLYTSRIFVNDKKDNRYAQLHVKLRNIEKTHVISKHPADGFKGFIVDSQVYGSDLLVVGNNVAHRLKNENNTIFTDEHIAVYENDSVFCVPLKAQIIATSELFEDHEVKEVIEMIAKRVSDEEYIIFECELPEHTKRFQVQVIYRDNSEKEKAVALDSIGVSLI